MGYLYALPKGRSFLGTGFEDAYHSVDSVSLAGGRVSVTVGVYPSREAKYAGGLLRNERIEPTYLPRTDTADVEGGAPDPDVRPDVASETLVTFVPPRPAVSPSLGRYTLDMAAGALYPEGIPYDLVQQKESLYPTVKRLLGMADAVDVIETVENVIGDDAVIDENGLRKYHSSGSSSL